MKSSTLTIATVIVFLLTYGGSRSGEFPACGSIARASLSPARL